MKEKRGDNVLGRKLDQIVRCSYTGSIDNRTEIAKIVTRFIDQPLAAVLDTADVKIRETIKIIGVCLLTDEWRLCKEYVESLKYTELLCLIDNTRIDPYEDNDWQVHYSIDAELPLPPFRYLGVSDICTLLKSAEKTNNTVKLFLSINVHSFFTYLESISNDSALSDVWSTLWKRTEALKIDMGANASIWDILNQADENRRIWSPWMPISGYYNRVLFIFAVYSSLLIDYFKCAYPE